DGGATCQQCMRVRRSTVVLQRAQSERGVHHTGSIGVEGTAVRVGQVVSLRIHGPVAIAAGIVRHNAVTDHEVGNDFIVHAATDKSGNVFRHGRIIEDERATDLENTAAAATKRGYAAGRII